MCGNRDFIYTCLTFRPHVVLIGRNDGIRGDWIRSLVNTSVVCLHSEQGYEEPERTVECVMVGHPHPRPPAHDETDVMAVINEETAGHLVGYLPEEMMRVVGYPRLLKDTLSTKARPVGHVFTVGIACGPDPLRKDNAYADWGSQLGEAEPERGWNVLGSLERYFAFYALEWAWLNRVTELSKGSYNTVARYRLTDNAYLSDESGVIVDKSNSLHSFFNQIDVLIFGFSSIGLEAMMAGIPAVSITSLLDRKMPFEEFLTDKTVQYSWRPESLEHLVELLERRRSGDLELTPRFSEFYDHAKETFFAGGDRDRSVEALVSLITELPEKGEPDVDLESLVDLIDFPPRARQLMVFLQRTRSFRAYQILLAVLKIRNSFYRRGVVDEGSFLPSFGGDGCSRQIVNTVVSSAE